MCAPREEPHVQPVIGNIEDDDPFDEEEWIEIWEIYIAIQESNDLPQNVLYFV